MNLQPLTDEAFSTRSMEFNLPAEEGVDCSVVPIV